jgi:glutathione S-transferase
MPWVDIGSWAGVDQKEFKNISAWIQRCKAREATQVRHCSPRKKLLTRRDSAA